MAKYSGKTATKLGLKNILYEKRNFRAVITINRPEVHNAINFETTRELSAAFEDASWSDDVAVVILTGAGERAFCTGADIKEWKEDFLARPNDFYKWMGAFIEMHDRLRNIGKPTIARLNGIVVGGGNELNIACDLAIAAEHVTIRQIGTARGSVPAAGATQWLPLIVGDRRAREILLLCEEIPAKKALEWGLINQVVPMRKLDSAVDELAEKLVTKMPESMSYTRQQMNFWRDLSWGLTIGHLRDWLTIHTGSTEVVEGITSFAAKRKVDYRKLRSNLSKICRHCNATMPGHFAYCGSCGKKL